MRLVTHNGSILVKRFGYEKSISLLAEAGFDAFDCTMDGAAAFPKQDDYIEIAKKIKRHADSLAFPCAQAHSDFHALNSKEDFDEIVKTHLRTLEVCEILECPILVVHPGNYFSAEQNQEWLYSKLIPTAERRGVKIATENMWNWDNEKNQPTSIPAACGTIENFCKQVDLGNSPYLTACVDIGHAEMTDAPGAANLIRALGHDRVGCLHVNDNDLIHDQHFVPFTGKIKWDEVINALRDINYQGDFTYESFVFFSYLPEELIPSALSYMEKVGRYFIRRITK
jgi:sugar phosphate isomerase/epimerase